MAKSPLRTGPQAALAVQLAVPLAGYLLAFVGLRFFAQVHAQASVHPIVDSFAAARREAYLLAAGQTDMIEWLAILGPVLLGGLVLFRLLRFRDPFAGLGLGGGKHGLGEAWSGFALGAAAHLFLLVAIAWLSGRSRPESIALAVQACAMPVIYLRNLHQALPPAIWMLPFVVFAYALARLAVSHAHLQRLVTELSGPTAGAATASVVFAAGYLAAPQVSLLAVGNMLLLGLLLAVYRHRTDRLWLPLGVLAGWVLSGYTSGVAQQGVPAEATPLFTGTLPAVISGGVYGHEGGLATTVLLSAWLLIVCRSRRQGPPPAA